MPNTGNRIWYAIKQVGISECGAQSYTAVHGLQSAGMNTRFNLRPLFEISQSEVYELKEDLPSVEITLEKLVDGYTPLYCLATKGAAAASISGRQNKRASVGMAFFYDDQDSASGTPLTRCVCSGMYVSAYNFSVTTDGPATEQVTLVGNNKIWSESWSVTTFANNDEPLAIAGSGGVNQRENVRMGSSASLWPTDIPGITSSGTNELISTGDQYRVHFRSARVSFNLGREEILELGRRGPYHRYAQFPVEVQTTLEITATSGDMIQALETSTANVSNKTIKIMMNEGTTLDMGSRNKLSSVTYGGANAGQNGGNATVSYVYSGYRMSLNHPQDPSGL